MKFIAAKKEINQSEISHLPNDKSIGASAMASLIIGRIAFREALTFPCAYSFRFAELRVNFNERLVGAFSRRSHILYHKTKESFIDDS